MNLVEAYSCRGREALARSRDAQILAEIEAAKHRPPPSLTELVESLKRPRPIWREYGLDQAAFLRLCRAEGGGG